MSNRNYNKDIRILNISKWMINNKATIREAAKEFYISKSLIHKDIHDRLIYLDDVLYSEMCDMLAIHFNNKHNNGGYATKLKYLNKK
jgi:putative DeoR family transcriptional regulator (stage III sporulation protein D)